jgi:hypothetical protein
MQIDIRVICLATPFVLPILTRSAAAQGLPACNTRVMRRSGNEITIGLQRLSNILKRDSSGVHSSFSNLQLPAEGGNKLKVSGKNNGTPVEISGPLEADGSGTLKLHADKIAQNGDPEKGLMSLTGGTWRATRISRTCRCWRCRGR